MESFGRFLRAEREARGVSIEDLAQVTKISRQVLIDLEADHFESLPAPVFLKGFVRTIARTLALPQQEVMERFDEFLKTHGPGAGQGGESSSSRSGVSQGGSNSDGPTPAPRESWGPMPFVLGVVALLVAIVIAYQVGSDEPPKVTKYANQPEAAEPAEPEPAATQSEEPAPEAEMPAEEASEAPAKPVTRDAKEPEQPAGEATEQPVAAAATPEPEPEAQAAPVPRNQWIILKARKEIWIRVSEDDEEPRNFKLDAGEQIRQRFAKALEIRVGDPSRLSVETPEGSFKTLGGATKPRTWNFPLSEDARAELSELSANFVEPEPEAPAAQPEPAASAEPSAPASSESTEAPADQPAE